MRKFCKRLSHLHETLPFIRVNVEALVTINLASLSVGNKPVKALGCATFELAVQRNHDYHA